MNTAAGIQPAVCSRVSALIEQANCVLDGFVDVPRVTFRASGTRAGTAFLQQNRVNFHRILLAHYPEEYFNHIIPHEIAHIVVHQLFGRVKPHGQQWQYVMQKVFNCSADVTHSLDVSVLNKKTWDYRCECKFHALTTRRHNAIARGKAKYYCRQCKEELRPD